MIHSTIHIEKKPPYLHGLLRHTLIAPTYISKNIHPLLSSEYISFVQRHTHDIRPYVQRHPKTPRLLRLSIKQLARARHSNIDGIHQIPLKSKAFEDLPTGGKLSLLFFQLELPLSQDDQSIPLTRMTSSLNRTVSIILAIFRAIVQISEPRISLSLASA